MNNRKFYDSRDDSPEIDANRQALHDACGQAYRDTGSVRTPEWKAASAKLRQFEVEFGPLYNPD